MAESWQIEAQNHTLTVGGTLHAEVLSLMLDEPYMLWTCHFVAYAGRKMGLFDKTVSSIESAMRKLVKMGAVHNHGGRGYLINDEVLTLRNRGNFR